jgi:hypothetical protein
MQTPIWLIEYLWKLAPAVTEGWEWTATKDKSLTGDVDSSEIRVVRME